MRPVMVVLVLLSLLPMAGAQGKLQRTREEPARQPSESADRADTPSSCADEGGFAELFAEPLGAVLGLTVAAPFVGPHALLGDSFERSALLPGHPYARPEGGFLEVGLRPENNHDGALLDPPFLKPWSLRLQLENGNDFDGLNRTGAHLFLDTASRFGVVTRWDHYRERLGCGCWDYTTLGDAHLTFRFAQSAAAQFHAGLGARWRFDRSDTSGGVSFLYGADFFPIDPLVVSTSIDLGNLDRQFVFRARASAGWQVGRCELLGGYDFLRFGSVNLQGPFVGLRLWF